MIVSEQTGRIVGFEFTKDHGLRFQIDAYPDDTNGVSVIYMVPFNVPFNRNRQETFNIDEFRGKRVKITVEMEEEQS